MELGYRKNEGASLKLGHSTALPDHLAGIVEVSAVHTPTIMRRQGLATELLLQVCDEADAEGMVLMLMPEGAEWLESWYARFGFATIQTAPVLMARPPNIKQGTHEPTENH